MEKRFGICELAETTDLCGAGLNSSRTVVERNVAARAAGVIRAVATADILAVVEDRASSVEDVRNTTAHTGSEVAAGTTEDDDATTSHVLATVVAGTLNDSVRARVTDGEPLGGDTTDERLTRRRTIQANVAA
ncbi:hypothetical protein NUW54_g1852 [Trametes sanguinea]|uniref:Uncharacterized protein n=1 Tax=Trametes sanguinea TaxID=158606 RepID=A0ACC1Q7K0_9APHY|nr:hypothetical protein NUW54_g1852 [Trametes sanguinea]